MKPNPHDLGFQPLVFWGGQMYSFPEINSKKHLKLDGWNATLSFPLGVSLPLFSRAMLAVRFRGV